MTAKWDEDWKERMAIIESQRQKLLAERAEHDRHDGIYYCCICLEYVVNVEQGEDTCPACLKTF